MAKNKESTWFILKISVILSLVCATLVSLAAVILKPIQDKNAALEKKINILVAAGVYKEGSNIDEVFANNIKAIAINLKTGELTNKVDVEKFNAVKAAKNPKTGTLLANDPAKIGAIAKYAVIYQLIDDGMVKRVVLPVRGYGLWGTMFGFLAMNVDGKTIEGLTFYDQKETPGLGGEILNPKWQSKWVGKKPYINNNQANMQLVKKVSNNPEIAKHQVDSLAGSTLTSRGVQLMINFWLSQQGYGPYLHKLTQIQ